MTNNLSTEKSNNNTVTRHNHRGVAGGAELDSDNTYSHSAPTQKNRAHSPK